MTAVAIVVRSTRKEERNAKPAPGPMYAKAGAGTASNTVIVRENMRRMMGRMMGSLYR